MVLVERYLNILENGNLEAEKEIESIVAITFTKKAAQEMIERIRGKLRDKYEDGEKWRRLYRDIGKSNISTIHGFCSSILRENPIAANIDPMFQILEDVEAEKILKSSIMEIISESMEKKVEIYNLYEKLEISTVSGLLEDFYYLYNNIRNIGEDLEKLKTQYLNNIKKLEIDLNDLNRIKESVIYLMENLRSNAKINNLLKEELWYSFKSNEYNNSELKEILNLILDNMGTSKPEAETIDELKITIVRVLKSFEVENIEYYGLIMDVLIEIDELYSRKKRSLSVLDYDDLQLRVLKLLDNKEIRKEYQKKYKYIMVDEFQDTNRIQKEIFYKLSSREKNLDRNNLFVVGDPKQSIYGFRGADLKVFYQVLDEIKLLNSENIITLNDNYRTSSNVMSFINNTFEELMAEKYDRLKSNIESREELSVEILEDKKLEMPKDISAANYSRNYEADLIGSRIKELVNTGDYRYGDFALLFRSTTRDYIYEEALKKHNIPYYNNGGRGYFERQEIMDSINALKAILSPNDLISNIGFLRSPMISLTDIQIYKIMKEKGTIYDKLKSAIEKDKIETTEIKEVLDLYENLRKFKNYNKTSELINEILKVTKYKELVLLKSESRQSLANLNKFVKLIKDFENLKRDESIDILEYIEELKTRNESQSKVESEQGDVVKLLTIHKSKGLEFPVVIIPEMSSSKFTDRSNINFHKDIGVGIKFKDSSGIHDEIKDLQGLEEDEEDKRIFYVAMTRAEEKLMLGMQGSNRGFKKMVLKIIDEKQINKSAQSGFQTEIKEEVRLLDDKLLLRDNEIKKPIYIYEDENFDNQIIENFSITQFLTFKECKRKYFFQYYKKLSKVNDILKSENDYNLLLDSEEESVGKDKSKLDPFVKGNIVHDFCQYYKLEMNKEKLLKKISSKYGVVYEEEKKELDVYIENYLKEYDESYEKEYREKNFMIKIKDGIFTGAIDRINIKENYIEIIDYKTNFLSNKDYLLKVYSPQLQFYSYVVKELLNKKVDKAKLMFLKNGESLEVDIRDEKIEELINELKKFVSFVLNNHNLEKYECKRDCDKKCEYDIICKRD